MTTEKPMTVGELIERLRLLDPKLSVGVHTYGCCPHAHDIRDVELSSATPVKELWHYDTDVVIQTS